MKNIIKKFTPSFLISWYHLSLAFLGAVFYRFSSNKIKIIGVTGTNGKSTVVELTRAILEEAGFKVASLSSIRFKIGNKEWPNLLKMTMPGRFQLQKFLKQTVNSSCQYAVLEVTSEGIKQHRHRFINFETAVFTNLTPEHIESHGSFENYRRAKGRLFQATKGIHIINIDDENSNYFLQFTAKKKIGFTVIKRNKEGISVIEAVNTEVSPAGLKFSINNTEFNLRLLSEFNIYNALAAICVGISQGINLEHCKSALEKIKGIPGRMEQVISRPFRVFVDYAFTPTALEKVYKNLIVNYKRTDSKLICVLGAAGGGRDKWKRPILGEIAGKYCDEVIVTNEDPYDENPMEIIDEVSKGAGDKARKILDRREAIEKSLKLSQAGDVVIITGKGCEPWICIERDKKIPWDDRRVVREEFKNLSK
jgi:UDP-N-acetylmuramoyl-L-alanyl-D-glutamate--2,6-diaminopimelate ligase